MKDEVYAIGYRRLPGGRKKRWAPLPIAATALSLAFRKRSTKIAFALCAMVVFGHGIALVGQVLVSRFASSVADAEQQGADMMAGVITSVVGEVHETLSMFLVIQTYTTALLLATVAAGLVAEDRRTRAFELYFSRPLSALDYAIGKLLVACVIPCVTIVLPFLALWLMTVGVAPVRLADELWGLGVPGAFAGLLGALFLGSTIVGASAWGERGRTVGVAYVLALLFLRGAADGLARAGSAWGGYLGLERDMQTVADAMLRVRSSSYMSTALDLREATNPSAWISAAVLVLGIVVGLVALAARLRKELRG